MKLEDENEKLLVAVKVMQVKVAHLEELEKIINLESEDTSKGDDPEEKLSLGKEFNRKISPNKLKQ